MLNKCKKVKNYNIWTDVDYNDKTGCNGIRNLEHLETNTLIQDLQSCTH